MDRKRIVIYIPTASFFVGGGEVVPLMQAKFLRECGYEVMVVVLRTKDETPYFQRYKQENPYISIEYFDSLVNKKDSFGRRKLDHQIGHELYYSLMRSFSEYCLRAKPNLVISHYAPAALAVPRSIKQILILHGVPDKWELINHVAVREVDKLLAVSRYVADGWRQMFVLNKIEVVHNGVDEKKFYPMKSVKEDIDIFYVGRLIEIKGVQHLIRAVSLLISKYKMKGLKVVIGGQGPYAKTLKALTENLGLKKQINFLGYIPDEELNKFYNRSRVCVFPSFAKEGVLTTMLEAASASRAIVVADCCGMVEFIKHRSDGLLFKAKDPVDLAQKLRVVLAGDSERKRLGKNARQKIIDSWTWKHSITKLDKVIHNLI